MKKLTLLLLLLLSACARNSQQADESGIQMEVMVDEIALTPTTLTVTLHDADGNPINDAYLNIKGDMNHPGMMPVIATADGGTDGVYTAPYEWTMGGNWVITVIADLGNGDTITREFPFAIP